MFKLDEEIAARKNAQFQTNDDRQLATSKAGEKITFQDD